MIDRKKYPPSKILDLFTEHVPKQGKAKTLGGEILRAVSRLDYRFHNDGDKIGIDEGIENVNSVARFIKHYVPQTKTFIDNMWVNYDDNSYSSNLLKIAEITRDYLCENDNLFNIKNNIDSYKDLVFENEQETDESHTDFAYSDMFDYSKITKLENDEEME